MSATLDLAPRIGPGRLATVLVLALLAGCTLFWRLGETPVSRSAEGRVADVAPNMVASGDWLVPVHDGEPRFQKPPLYYWMVAAFGVVLGPESRVALRLPAALAAVGLLALVYAWGRDAGGPRQGAAAVLLLMAMIQFWTLGRRGVAEMPLVLATTAALFAFDRSYWGRSEHAWIAFFAAFWLAFMAKATVALLLVGVPVLLRLGLDGQLRPPRRARVWLGAGLCALAGLAWYGALVALVPESRGAFADALVRPFGLAEESGAAGHVRAVWYFVPELFDAAAPAVAGLALLPGYWRRHRPGPREGFPLLALAALFVAISLVPMKQKHYLLPLLPLLALSLAPALVAALDEHREPGGRVVRVLSVPLLVAAPGLVAAWVGHGWLVGESGWVIASASLGLLAAAGGAFVAARHGRIERFALAALAAFWIGLCAYQGSVQPWRERFHEGVAHERAGFDAVHWQQAFERHPWLRSLYRARDWQPLYAAPSSGTAKRSR